VVELVLVEVESPPPLPHEAMPETANSTAKKTPSRTLEPTELLFNISIVRITPSFLKNHTRERKRVES